MAACAANKKLLYKRPSGSQAQLHACRACVPVDMVCVLLQTVCGQVSNLHCQQAPDVIDIVIRHPWGMRATAHKHVLLPNLWDRIGYKRVGHDCTAESPVALALVDRPTNMLQGVALLTLARALVFRFLCPIQILECL